MLSGPLMAEKLAQAIAAGQPGKAEPALPRPVPSTADEPPSRDESGPDMDIKHRWLVPTVALAVFMLAITLIDRYHHQDDPALFGAEAMTAGDEQPYELR